MHDVLPWTMIDPRPISRVRTDRGDRWPREVLAIRHPPWGHGPYRAVAGAVVARRGQSKVNGIVRRQPAGRAVDPARQHAPRVTCA